MTTRWNIDELRLGASMEATFEPNPVEGSRFRHRSFALDGRDAPKPVLCGDRRVRPGVPTLVRLKAIHKPQRSDRGYIEVDYLSDLGFALDDVYVEPMTAKKLQILLENGLNILLDGPQGCGKTVAARAIARALSMEFVFFNCSAVVEATDFLATLTVRATPTGQPVTAFLETDLLRALTEAASRPERRVLVFLDEFNRCHEGARNALMPALDSTRRIFNPVTAAFIDIPDNVQFIAAVNRGDSFTGTYGIDAAQLDRFAPLAMDYMPPEEEARLLERRHPTLGQKLLRAVVDTADRLRSARELRRGLSVRATDEACTYLEHPLMSRQPWHHLPEVFKSSFCGRYNGRWSDSASDADIAWALIQAELAKS